MVVSSLANPQLVATSAKFKTLLGTKPYTAGSLFAQPVAPILDVGQYAACMNANGYTNYWEPGNTIPPGNKFLGIYIDAPSSQMMTTVPVAPPITNLVSTGTSAGGNFLSSDGNIINIPAGGHIPTGWVAQVPGSYVFGNGLNYIQVVPGSNTNLNAYAATQEGFYQVKGWDRTGMSFTIYNYKKGEVITADGASTLLAASGPGAPAPVVTPNETIFTPTEAAAGAAAEVDPTAPVLPPADIPAGRSNTSIIPKLLLIVGAGGVIYLGYLIVAEPELARNYINRFSEVRELFVDSKDILISLALIVATSYVAYELYAALEANNWDIGAALGSLAASVIEVFVKGFVDATETLLKDLGTWIENVVDNIV